MAGSYGNPRSLRELPFHAMWEVGVSSQSGGVEALQVEERRTPVLLPRLPETLCPSAATDSVSQSVSQSVSVCLSRSLIVFVRVSVCLSAR